MKRDFPVHTSIATHRGNFFPTYMPAPDFMRSQRLIAAEKTGAWRWNI
jgi:hypothetical protein